MLRPCTARDAAAGLRSVALETPPDWLHQREFGGEAHLRRPDLRARRCAQEAFDAFLCSLPLDPQRRLPPAKRKKASRELDPGAAGLAKN